MIAVDTNVLARYYVIDEADRESARQHAAALRLFSTTERLFVSKTVLLEFEWVLRGFYEQDRPRIVQVFTHLLALPTVSVEDESTVQRALKRYAAGFDFADALHHASSAQCEAFATFDDRGFVRKAGRFKLDPPVSLVR